MRIRAALAGLLALLVLPAAASAAQAERPGEPVVLTGADAGKLAGAAPGSVVAYAYRDRAKRSSWRRIPVQVDERVEIDFGINPNNNTSAGTPGTVYGTQPIGVTALQYADPDTFVGPDTDPDLDADDEIALMAADAGDAAGRRAGDPRGVKAQTARRIEIKDSLGGKSFAYLYEAQGKGPKAAPRDYVDYEFALGSGDYRTTYLRADGPNPEASTISTDSYVAGFSDRWMYDTLRIKEAKGARDVLDGFKFQFAPGSCARSEATFNDAEGAFVANIDGPVRAIRSYVGANSGPLTERTHYFYDSRHVIATDLRVHAITGAMFFHDLSEAGTGMTFLNSENPGGVPVDGTQDTVSPAVADWRMWTGEQGSLFAADRLDSTFAESFTAAGSEFYLDDSTPDVQQCWGDGLALGQAGFRTTAAIPNTDPRMQPFERARTTTTEILAAPGADAGDAGRWSRELDEPLRVRAR